jgi:hypothetical protein
MIRLLLLLSLASVVAFTTAPLSRPWQIQGQTQLFEICNNGHSDNKSSKSIGDPLREATGIRPSLHPATINALAQALKIRAQNVRNPEKSLIVSEETPALEVAMRAGKIAADAIDQRQKSSNQDGMVLTPEEQQTIAGRVVGVVMRFSELEALLVEKVRATGWIAKFGDWDSFGVLANEDNLGDVQQRVKDDPLFTMTRAECLLALFLKTVETPS